MVFWARTVLGKETSPMLPVGVQLEAAGLLHSAHGPRRNRLGRLLAPIEDAWVLRVENNPQAPDSLGRGREHAVAEIQPEEIDVVVGEVTPIDTKLDVGRVRHAIKLEDGRDWCGGWDSNPHVLSDGRF